MRAINIALIRLDICNKAASASSASSAYRVSKFAQKRYNMQLLKPLLVKHDDLHNGVVGLWRQPLAQSNSASEGEMMRTGSSAIENRQVARYAHQIRNAEGLA